MRALICGVVYIEICKIQIPTCVALHLVFTVIRFRYKFVKG